MPAPCRPYEISSCIIPLTGERHKRGWEEFPVRLGGIAFLTDRKLFAYSFLFGLMLWCFLPTGNFSRIVSYSTWHCGVSYRQETFREGVPARLGTVVFLTGRKLFAKGFLLGVTPLCFLPTGNCLRKVSCSTRLHCGVSYRQETSRQEIPRLRFATLEMTEGAWRHGVSYRQETICKWFPTRRDTVAFLTGRKLFAKGFLLGVTPLCFLPTGNCLRRVSYSTWHCVVSYRQETFRWEISRLRFAALEMTEGRGGSMFHTVQ